MSPHAEEPQERKQREEDNDISEETFKTQLNGHVTHGNVATSIAQRANKSHLRGASGEGEGYDLICVGFGPANLALAIALHDALDERKPLAGLSRLYNHPPKVLFLERQSEYRWHRGMLLPGAKMQISFLKDLATMRNPKSEFTFLNYLHKKNRLASFSNLDTFLPHRIEYEDYMRWCAAAFDDVVLYGHEVLQIRPELRKTPKEPEMIDLFEVVSKDVESGDVRHFKTKNVVLGLGGRPQLPPSFPQHPRVFHSAHYSMKIDQVLPEKLKPYTIAVVGCGQSAAEIFNDLQSRYPNAKTRLLIRGTALRPSDDSPFVNEIFDPERIDSFYNQTAEDRMASIAEDRATNYGVVRIGLLEHIYENLYMQRLNNPNADDWQHQILRHRHVLDAQAFKTLVKLRIRNTSPRLKSSESEDTMTVDALVVATGYSRNLHEDILEPMNGLKSPKSSRGAGWTVSRDYRIQLNEDRVAKGNGVWLTGCNENTHGLSDTLLSVLATRGDELAKSIFGD